MITRQPKVSLNRSKQTNLTLNPFSARFHLPLNSKRLSGGGIKESWNAVTLQGNQVIYRLFMEWRHRGQVNVRLLCETNLTSCVVKGKLPLPHRVYVSVVFVKEVHKFLAGNIRSYPTKKVVIPDIDDLPTKPGERCTSHFS